MLGRVLLGLSGSERMRNLVERAPISRGIVARFIAGDETADAVRAAADLVGAGLTATIDHLGEDTLDRAQAERVAEAYVELLAGLRGAGLTDVAEVSVKLSAVGQALPGDGEKIALD
ncbi:MAG: proline dehydrogenase, partial [Jiangellaceae bacterium]